MKKLYALSLVVVLFAVGCGKKEEAAPAEEAAPTTEAPAEEAPAPEAAPAAEGH